MHVYKIIFKYKLKYFVLSVYVNEVYELLIRFKKPYPRVIKKLPIFFFLT